MAQPAPHRVPSAYRAHPHFIRPTAAALAVAACFSGPVFANPTAPTVVNGSASFATAGNILNITNSHNAIINWGSFSIGVNELTKFIQPSALSAVLNRVTGQDPSAILGALQSNGKVFLLNPNGIVFGAGSQVNVAGLVASTLNLSDSDFLAGRMRFTDGAGAGSVVNNGSITGGSVYLVGNAVTNNGLITSPGGDVVLVAGNSVELVNPGTPNLRVEIVAPDNEARNLGTITADAGRIGIYAGLINNSGTLNASSAVAEGGKILLKAKKDVTLTASSVLDASGKGGGDIIALADNNTYVDGTLNASAPASGNGGFIETSGKNRVKIADSALVTTEAPQGSKGTWLIDPNDFVIAAGGDITGSALSSILQNGGTDIVISTASYGGSPYYGSGAYGGDNGDILVQDAVSWNSGNGLTLTAERNVQVDQAITNLGTGSIRLNAGWDALSTPATPSLTNSAAAILLNAPISTGGSAYLHAGGNIIQGASAPIMATNLQAVSDSGMVNLGGSVNTVGTLAGKAIGSFAFKNSGALTIGTVDSISGIDVTGVNPGKHALIDVNVTGGPLTINNQVRALGSNAGGGVPEAGGDATIALSATNGITVNSNDVIAIDAYGGSGAYGGAGGAASIQLTAGSGAISRNSGVVQARAGSGGYDGNSGVYGPGGAANVKFTAANGIVIDGGEAVQAYGGDGGTGGAATVELITASSVSIANYSSISADGGVGTAGTGGGALVLVSSSGNTTVNNSRLEASGGYANSDQGGAAAITMLAGGNIQIDGAEGVASGGSGTTGGNAAVTVVAGGDINNVQSNVTANAGAGSTMASVVLVAAGNVNLDYVYVNTNGVAGLGGTNILLDNASVSGDTGVVVSATGNLDLTSSSYLRADSGIAYVSTGGNVTLNDNSSIYAPDVMMSVGGVVNMNSGSTIGASLPSTIHLTFPMLTSGGYFVNGVEGVVYDEATFTGFCSPNCPAILGTNLLVTYGGGAATLNIPTDALIVAMGESSKPPDPEKDKDVFEDLKKDKDKEAPVCR